LRTPSDIALTIRNFIPPPCSMTSEFKIGSANHEHVTNLRPDFASKLGRRRKINAVAH
jgi:hypothetical protein